MMAAGRPGKQRLTLPFSIPLHADADGGYPACVDGRVRWRRGQGRGHARSKGHPDSDDARHNVRRHARADARERWRRADEDGRVARSRGTFESAILKDDPALPLKFPIEFGPRIRDEDVYGDTVDLDLFQRVNLTRLINFGTCRTGRMDHF